MVMNYMLSEEEQMKYLSKKDKEAILKIKEFNALSPEGKIEELQRQLKEMRVRAVAAESDLATLKENYGISVDHKDSIIESLKRQNEHIKSRLRVCSQIPHNIIRRTISEFLIHIFRHRKFKFCFC